MKFVISDPENPSLGTQVGVENRLIFVEKSSFFRYITTKTICFGLPTSSGLWWNAPPPLGSSVSFKRELLRWSGAQILTVYLFALFCNLVDKSDQQKAPKNVVEPPSSIEFFRKVKLTCFTNHDVPIRPTLWDFCVSMIRNSDIKGTESNGAILTLTYCLRLLSEYHFFYDF